MVDRSNEKLKSNPAQNAKSQQLFQDSHAMIKFPCTPYSCPWEKVASDLFELNKTDYSYFSRFVEIRKLTSILAMYLHKSHHSAKVHICLTVTLVTDNGSQFISNEMNQFSSTYGFHCHHAALLITTSQMGKLKVSAVKTVKSLLTKSKDPLLSYKATPGGLSPAQLLMGHIIRTDVPQYPTRMVLLERFARRRGDIQK